MTFVPIVVAVLIVIIIFLKLRGSRRGEQEPTQATLRNSHTGTPRMTSRRKLREILASEQYKSLTDWEKAFCTDVNRQTGRLTWAQSDKIDEIWSSINDSIKMEKRFREQSEAAFKSLQEIIESPAFQALPDKDKKYMRKIYDEGEVSGSYRIRRIQEVHDRILGRTQ